jgi:hypothetical protein
MSVDVRPSAASSTSGGTGQHLAPSALHPDCAAQQPGVSWLAAALSPSRTRQRWWRPSQEGRCHPRPPAPRRPIAFPGVGSHKSVSSPGCTLARLSLSGSAAARALKSRSTVSSPIFRSSSSCTFSASRPAACMMKAVVAFSNYCFFQGPPAPGAHRIGPSTAPGSPCLAAPPALRGP